MLQSKTKMPPLTMHIVSRKELIENYANLRIGVHGFDKKATLIIAPAGYGKTVFAQEWLSNQKHPVMWCTCEESTKEIYDFICYLIASINVHYPNVGQTVISLMQEDILFAKDDQKVQHILSLLIDELAEIESPVYLVIDDSHVFKESITHKAMIYLIEQATPMIHFVLITRFLPPFPILKWQSKNMIQTIGAKELKFTFNEMTDFIKNVHSMDLNSEQLMLLYEKCEGWITAIILYLIGLEQRGIDLSIEDYLAKMSGNQEQILTYITDEFFTHLDQRTQDLLIKTSFLDKFSEDILRDITGDDNIIDVFDTLKKHQLFIVALDYENKWYRYHYILSALLKKKAQDYSSETVHAMRQKAIDYYMSHDMPLEALKQAYQGRYNHMAATILEKCAFRIMEEGGALNVAEGLKLLDEHYLLEYPLLKLLKIFLLLVVNGKGNLEDELKEAESLMYDNPEKQQLYKGVFHVVKCLYLIYEHDLKNAYSEADQALLMLPLEPYFWRMSVAVMCGDMCVISGEPNKGYTYYLQAHHANLTGKHYFFVLSTGIKIAYALRKLSRLEEMGIVLNDMLSIVKNQRYHKSSKSGAVWGFYALYLYEKGDYEASKRSLERGKRLSKSELLFYAWVLLLEIEILIEEGAYQEALTIVQEIQSYDRHSSLNHLVRFEASIYYAYLHAKLGLVGESMSYFDQISIDFKAPFTADKLLGYLLRLEVVTEEGNITEKEFNVIEKNLRNLCRLGQNKHAEIKLERIKLSFFEKLASNSSNHLRLNLSVTLKEKGYNRLLNHVSGQTNETTSKDADVPYIEPLSSRELEILKLISSGLSNQAICETLFLSLSTVKWHTSNIYGKLGVKGRTQAVAIARKLQLI